MKLIIVGAGPLAVHIARELITEKHDIIILEKDAERARIVSNELDCLVINDDGTNSDVLVKAGLHHCLWFLALTDSDEINMVSCGLASSLNRDIHTVARVANPFYSALSREQQKALGLSHIIDPDRETAKLVSSLVEQGFAEAVVPLHDGKIQMRRVEAGSLPSLHQKSLAEFRAESKKDFLLAAATRKGKFIIPSGNFFPENDDILYFLGRPEELDALIGPVESLKTSTRKVLIVGATNLCERLLELLLYDEHGGKKKLFRFRSKRHISILDASREEGKRLVKRFQNIEVSFADSSEEPVLEEAGVAKADLVLCVTESQSYNIITAQLAKTLGAKKSMAISRNDRYMGILPSMDVDAIISKESASTRAVLELVRKAHIRTLHAFYEEYAEIVELVLGKDSPANGQRLLELGLPAGILVAFVQKGSEVKIPTGQTLIEEGDVLGFVLEKNDMPLLEKMFGGHLGS